MAKSPREKAKQKVRYVNAKEVAAKESQGFEMSTINLPPGMERFSFKKEGQYKLDIIPYIVGKGNPQAGEGLAFYKRRYYVHKDVGVNNKWIVCPARTFGKTRCPICEDVSAKLREGEDVKLVNPLKDKMRELYLVIDHDEMAKGVQLYEGPFYSGLGELLTTELEAMDEDDGDRDFFCLEGGRTLKIFVKEESVGSGKFKKPVSIKFMARKEDLPEDLLDKAPCLDDIIKEMPYDEMKKMYYQLADDDVEDNSATNGEEEEEEEVSDKKQPTAQSMGLKVGSKVVYRGETCEVKKISPDGSSMTLVDGDGEVYKMVAPSAVKIAGGKKVAPPPVEEDEDEVEDPSDLEEDSEDSSDLEDNEDSEDDSDLDESDEEEEEPPAKKKGKR